MRILLVACLGAFCLGALAQKSDLPDLPGGDKPAPKAEDKKAKPRPRINLERKGGNVGDDAAGGGGNTGASSKGGTPGTPSGSFSGNGPRP
jgi:hypothetical protein